MLHLRELRVLRCVVCLERQRGCGKIGLLRAAGSPFFTERELALERPFVLPLACPATQAKWCFGTDNGELPVLGMVSKLHKSSQQ